MRCIFCLKERLPSLEHVIPLAIGGTIEIDRVCEPCNSTLGSRVDSALTDFFPIRMRRAQLKLAGNSGVVPELFEMFVGKAKLVGETVNQVRTTINKATGKLDHRLIHQASEFVGADGKINRQISIDEKDQKEIPKIIQRDRKRRGLSPLSEDALIDAAKQFTVKSIENPLVHIDLKISFAYLRHAMMKIAYELAFMWLGESYLDDPMAAELRDGICSADIASTNSIKGYVVPSNEEPFKVFQSWVPHESHHLVYSSVVADNVIIAIRIFDLYGAGIVVSEQANRYFKDRADSAKLRFVAIDVVSGRTINTTFDEESRRIAELMTKHGRFPPFHDPLSVE